MSDVKLRRIAIRNWMTIRDAELEFPENGLVLVVGDNQASGGKLDSVGSGKTALGEAISRTLVGINGRFTNLGHYSYKSNGNSLIDLSVDLLGKPLRVEMGFKCKEMSQTGEALRFTSGDLPTVERGHPDETREELQSILGVTPELAQWSVYIDGDKLRFNKQSERQAVNLLMSALRQPSWDAYQKRASKVLNDAKAKNETAQSLQQSSRESVASIKESIASAKADLDGEKSRLSEETKRLRSMVVSIQEEIKSSDTQVEELEARHKEIKKRLKELEDEGAVEYHKLETGKATLNTQISEARVKRTAIIEKRAEARSVWSRSQTALDEMQNEPDKCPNCGKPWDKAHSAVELKSQAKKTAKAKEDYEAFTPKVNSVDKTISELESEVRVLDGKVRALNSSQEAKDLSYESEQNAEKLDLLKGGVTDLRLRLQKAQQGPDQSGISRKTAIVEERKAQMEKAQASMEDAAQKLVDSEALLKVAQYWYEAFGPTGIPNMILSEAIKPLNEIAKRISLLMTGGTIEITYDTSRELAKGGSSSELVIKVKNKIGSSRVDGSSKGESGLINLIIAETLSEVGSVSNRIGYRWYDECLTHQDSAVRRSIMSYLRDTAHRLGILIFVVDHSAEASNYCDYVLVARKSASGATTYEWQH